MALDLDSKASQGLRNIAESVCSNNDRVHHFPYA
jgi:hypothetical protein